MEADTMTEYHATEDDMRAYSEIIKNLAMLDIQRNQVIEALRQWEQAHAIPEEAPADAPTE